MTASVEIPQGGSPETQAIIDACHQGSWSTLVPLIEARNKAADQALDSFLGQAEQQGDDFLKTHDASLQRVEDAFDKYQEALDGVVVAARGQNIDEAKVAATNLAVASFGIRSAVVAYEESYLSYGDSRFPIINLLTNLGEMLRGGKIAVDVWQATCQRYGGYYEKGLEEIDNSSEANKPGVQERRQAIATLFQLFQKLGNLGPSDSRKTYEDILFDVMGRLVELSEAFEAYHTHVFLTGETKSPRINLVIKVARGVLAGTYNKSVLRALTTELSDELEVRISELNRLAKQPQESELLNDLVADMLDVLESLDDGVQVLVALANGETVEQAEIQEALDLLQESGDVLSEVNTSVTEFNEKQGNNTQMDGTGVTSTIELEEGVEDEYGQPIITTVMQELFEKVDAFDRGTIDADAFLAVLEDFDQRIDGSEDKLSQIVPPEMPENLDVEQRAVSREFITIADDALSLLEVALAECREGIAHLRHFAETDEKEAIGSGKELYFDGTQKMWLVARAQKRVEDFIEASGNLLGEEPAGPSGGMSAPTNLSSRFSDEMR